MAGVDKTSGTPPGIPPVIGVIGGSGVYDIDGLENTRSGVRIDGSAASWAWARPPRAVAETRVRAETVCRRVEVFMGGTLEGVFPVVTPKSNAETERLTRVSLAGVTL